MFPQTGLPLMYNEHLNAELEDLGNCFAMTDVEIQSRFSSSSTAHLGRRHRVRCLTFLAMTLPTSTVTRKLTRLRGKRTSRKSQLVCPLPRVILSRFRLTRLIRRAHHYILPCEEHLC